MHGAMLSKILIFLFSSALILQAQGPDTPFSTAAQQGPMALEKNFTLAQKYPVPSAWLLANACAGCHGTNGAEMDNEIPPIVGMDQATFISTMKAYQTERPSKETVMTIVAEPLSDAEIKAMAEYFSKQKVREWTQADWHKDVKAPSWAKHYEKEDKKVKEHEKN
jgi:sulfide dehydrogenase cytochrome subunit